MIFIQTSLRFMHSNLVVCALSSTCQLIKCHALQERLHCIVCFIHQSWIEVGLATCWAHSWTTCWVVFHQWLSVATAHRNSAPMIRCVPSTGTPNLEFSYHTYVNNLLTFTYWTFLTMRNAICTSTLFVMSVSLKPRLIFMI